MIKHGQIYVDIDMGRMACSCINFIIQTNDDVKSQILYAMLTDPSEDMHRRLPRTSCHQHLFSYQVSLSQ